MTHYLIIVLVAIVICIIDGRKLLRKRLQRELYTLAVLAAVILIYGFLYFSNSYNASIADIMNRVLVHK